MLDPTRPFLVWGRRLEPGMSEPSLELPTVIQRYQQAHDRHDVDGAVETFAAAATVVDENQRWSGTDEIRAWLAKTSSEYTFTRSVLGAQAEGENSWLVRNRLEGNFPGGTVDLSYRFVLGGGRIVSLTIAP
jgi:predicted proteasome-type protease